MKIIGLFAAFVFLGVFAVLLITNQETLLSSRNTTVNPTLLPITPPANISEVPSIALSPTTVIDTEKKTQTAVIKTSKGDITVELYASDAPKTVANFVNKSKSGFYNNLIFWRVEDWVIQGGDPKGDGTGGDNMPTELNNQPFLIGSLGVARGNDVQISNDAQFFITKQNADWLNNQYTNFGMVTAGMDVVSKIEIGDKILGITIQ